MEHPFTCIVAGPTKSGKSTFVKRLIEKRKQIISTDFNKIWWCFNENQVLHKSLQKVVNFVDGMPDFKLLKSFSPQPQLLILDDLMQDMKNNKELITLFTRGCHHWNISVIHIVQNLFFEGMRTARINSDYLILFKNPADQLQAQVLARQLFPTNTKYFLEAYKDATRAAHGYLFVDLTQNTDDLVRLQTDILSPTPTCYLPKL